MSESMQSINRVLIVEPSRTMRQLIRAEFDPKRFEVVEARGSAEAIAAAVETAPTIVTLGTVLPDGTGADTCRQLVELFREQDITIIVVTSEDSDEERDTAFHAGTVHFVKKGFKPGELACYVDSILRPRRELVDTRILIVDDSDLPRECLKRVLVTQGANVVEADDGTEALKILGRESIDLVITDHFMSELNGLDLIRRIRSIESFELMPIILLSAVRGHAVSSAALKAGANDFVRKPFEASEMMARINVCLRTARLEKKLKAATAEAYQASEAKSRFLANMSHEIRTPMTAVLGFAERLRDEVLTQPERNEAIGAICRNGEHLLGLINDILDFSKIEAGKMTVERIDCGPQRIIEDVIVGMRQRVKDKGLALHLNFLSEIPEKIQTDPVRFRQILINLIGNAFKFTEKGGITINVSMAAPGATRMAIAVEDTGVGMSPEVMSALFQPFTQADSSTARRFGGTGLGLTICKQLARLLGGEVAVESRPDFGSKFTMIIDTGPLDGVRMLKPDESADVVDDSSRQRIAAVSSIQLTGRVLLADDGIDNQRLISAILRKTGLNVSVVGDGREAVDQALAAADDRKAFDVILMDMQMPVLDGLSATRELRDRGYGWPILALTANATTEDCNNCMDAGCDDFLTKPIDKSRLLTTIARHLPQAVGV